MPLLKSNGASSMMTFTLPSPGSDSSRLVSWIVSPFSRSMFLALLFAHSISTWCGQCFGTNCTPTISVTSSSLVISMYISLITADLLLMFSLSVVNCNIIFVPIFPVQEIIHRADSQFHYLAESPGRGYERGAALMSVFDSSLWGTHCPTGISGIKGPVKFDFPLKRL